MPKKIVANFNVEYWQVLSPDGNVDKKLMPELSPDEIKELYELMLLARTFDDKAFHLQRQGRIGTYLPVKGQEASQVGTAYALDKNDWILPSGRDIAACITRKLPIHMILLYRGGDARGAQIPEGLNIFPFTIPSSTHITHCTGVAWASKLLKQKAVVMGYFGDGASSRGDFHEGLNFAGVYKVPVVFVCENNGYAISLPREKQTAAETIAQRAFSYGFEGIQVDGNDVFAAYAAAKYAVEKARKGKGPTLIECVTYRMGDHSTADDATRYRSQEEVAQWAKRDPIETLEKYMRKNKLLDEKSKKTLFENIKAKVEEAVTVYEKIPPPQPEDMFKYTYAQMPEKLKEQMEELNFPG
ncbi:MAG TPA: pyruvate dehydrogenase (acetyl-transferring) E1 component subunit alpha [Candidatus Hypogeohydataceae bacterium YC41]